MESSQSEFVDALVIGSGLAGLNFALEFSQRNPNAKVLVIAKTADALESSTAWAQGGIAAVFGADDDCGLHIQDTLETGGGLSSPEVVRMVVEEGRSRVLDLIKHGVPFAKVNQEKNAEFDLTREGGHSRRRILHVADHTGKSIAQSLLERLKENPQIELRTKMIAVDLVTDKKIQHEFGPQNSTCLGAYVLSESSNQVHPIHAKITVLATGGAAKVYKYTSNPDSNSGDGIAMAHRLGILIANMEFIQFHPTCLFHPNAKSALLSEALRGEGAYLLNRKGERFMRKYHPKLELAPRDIVALSIDKEMKQRGDECVYLDISHKGAEFIESHFPHNLETCLSFGFDLRKQPVPVVPAAHYTCGGIVVDTNGKTEIEGLYAIGETAHTGLHGANRLASNSLLEAAVFSYRAAVHASKVFGEISHAPRIEMPAWNPGFAKVENEEVIIQHSWDEIRTVMWNYVGIVRSDRRLDFAARRISLLDQEIQQCYWERKLNKNLIELRNLVTLAGLIVKSAQSRKESRGLHQNMDFPNRNDGFFARDTLV